jgi:hypothetical protein
MTGSDIQGKLDAIVLDLQTTHKGSSVDIGLRDDAGGLHVYPLSSDANGVVNAQQLATINDDILANNKSAADAFYTASANVRTATAALTTARKDAVYIQKKTDFDTQAVMENSNNLSDARGRYVK